jgi:hypothetical protein
MQLEDSRVQFLEMTSSDGGSGNNAVSPLTTINPNDADPSILKVNASATAH